MALALVLWKFLRMTASLQKTSGGGTASVPTDDSMEWNNKAIRLARDFGIKDEFFHVLFNLPVCQIHITNTEGKYFRVASVLVRKMPDPLQESKPND